MEKGDWYDGRRNVPAEVADLGLRGTFQPPSQVLL